MSQLDMFIPYSVVHLPLRLARMRQTIMSWSGDVSPRRPEAPDGDDEAPVSAQPLRSQFPGELSLRDNSGAELQRFSPLIVARFVVLQLAERYAAGLIEAKW